MHGEIKDAINHAQEIISSGAAMQKLEDLKS
jgi:anthranilate phosphoribosyltransferase